jgi:hypothetical protein
VHQFAPEGEDLGGSQVGIDGSLKKNLTQIKADSTDKNGSIRADP